jgi:hypothetical protein
MSILALRGMNRIYQVTDLKVNKAATSPFFLESGEFHLAAPQQEVKMVGEQGPGETFHAGFDQQGGKSVNKQGAVAVVKEDIPTLYSPHDHVLEQAGHVNSSASWHEQNISGSRP